VPKIVIENGPDRGRSYVIRSEGSFYCGRDPTAQVPIQDEMASRRHFQIDYRDGRFRLRDLESKNGVFLNGSRLVEVADLAPNDRIQVGETLLTFVGDEPHPLLGRTIAGYRIEDRIGRGGMGTVYRAVQLSLDRTVALKILSPQLVENQNFINLFIREARAAGALSHPNIVQVYDVGVEDSVYFYSMEFIPHGSVEDLLNRTGRIPLPRTLEIIRDAALGLQYAELKGLVHRDIKPGNLMIGSENVIKIGDLGIARFGEGEGRVSQKDGVSGSPHYIAPEQARGFDIDHRADIYSLGISFYQLLCGQTPYRGSTPREVIRCHLREEPPPLPERAPDIPAPVVELVSAMMAKDREARIPSATAVLERLEPLLRRYREGGAPAAPTRSRRRAMVAFLGLALVCALAVAGTILYLQYESSRREAEARLETWTGIIERAEGERLAGDIARVSATLASLGDPPLPAELDARRRELALWVDERRAAEEREAHARLLREAFAAAERSVAGLEPAAAIAAWDEFIAAYAGTEPAAEAKRRRDEIAAHIAAETAREQAAQLRFAPILATARSLAAAGDYRRALEQLSPTALGEGFVGTAADRTRTEEITAIEGAARDAWTVAKESIAEDLDAGRFAEAKLRIGRFRDLAFLSGEIAARDEEIAERERQAKEGDGGAEPPDPLGITIAEAWRIWALADEGGESGPGRSLRAATDRLQDFELRSILSAEEKTALDRHVTLLRRLPALLDTLGARIPTPPPRIDLVLAGPDGGTVSVDLESFDRKSVRGRASGDPRRRVSEYWWELAPASRIAVLRSAELPLEELPLLGLLAAANGDRALAEQMWNAAGAADRALVEELRRYAARAPTSD